MALKKHLLILTLLVCHFAKAQMINNKVVNNLSHKSFDDLTRSATNPDQDSHKSRIFTQAWLLKAKLEKDYKQMALAYKVTLYLENQNKHLLYADSIVQAAKQTDDNVLIGQAYMTKATVYYGRKEHTKALDNFIKADEYIAETDDDYSIHKVKYGIAQTKYYLGFYDEAIALLRECIDYFKEENDRAYLNSLHALGLCYNRIGNYAWCTITNQTGIDEGKKLDNLEMELYFIHSEGVNLCGKKRYREAIRKLTMVVPGIIDNKDFGNESVAFFYIGKSYWSLKQYDKAVSYFKKVDSIFVKKKYIRPDLREGYEKLIDFYRDKNDTKSQLFYINRLLKVDSVLGHNYKYLLKKIVKEYDTKLLLKSKVEIENAMSLRTKIGFTVIIALIVIIAGLIYRHFKNKRLFRELMERDTAKKQFPKMSNKTVTQEISPEIEAAIVKNLEKFERDRKYLEKDMNLGKMASILNTNTKYVTKIIAKHRGKGTIEYISDLKIDYIIELLKTENKYRNYTNKALGEETGFGSTQNFTKAFKVRTGISPTYFIYKLKNLQDK